jgi:hypothetical protein
MMIDEAANVKITKDGFLIAHPRVARAGVELCDFTSYGRDWLRVWRPEDELFRPNTLASLAGKPITLDHPPEPVDARSWKRVAVGTTGDVKDVLRDGTSARISILLMDADAIRAVQSGTRQPSFAHTGTITPCSGVTDDGEQYDAIQTHITFGDHLAIVDEARGGSSLSIGDSRMSFHSHFSDGQPDFTSPHRPGYRFLDNNDADRLAANAAYEQMRQRLNAAWRNKDAPGADNRDAAPSRRTLSLDALQAQAEQAWRERSKRMSNAWRNKEA